MSIKEVKKVAVRSVFWLYFLESLNIMISIIAGLYYYFYSWLACHIHVSGWFWVSHVVYFLSPARRVVQIGVRHVSRGWSVCLEKNYPYRFELLLSFTIYLKDSYFKLFRMRGNLFGGLWVRVTYTTQYILESDSVSC
jgi:hypothetical protein